MKRISRREAVARMAAGSAGVALSALAEPLPTLAEEAATSTRHTAATRLVKGHLPLQMVSRILGHSQPQTSYRYLSAVAETATQAAAILEELQAQNTQVQQSSEGSEMVN